MPNYTVECSECGFESGEFIPLDALEAWDAAAACPSCQVASGKFRRVIKYAPAFRGGAKGAARTAQSKKIADSTRFRTSGEKDAMRHKAFQNTNHEQIAAARESVAKGEFEGF